MQILLPLPARRPLTPNPSPARGEGSSSERGRRFNEISAHAGAARDSARSRTAHPEISILPSPRRGRGAGGEGANLS